MYLAIMSDLIEDPEDGTKTPQWCGYKAMAGIRAVTMEKMKQTSALPPPCPRPPHDHDDHESLSALS